MQIELRRLTVDKGYCNVVLFLHAVVLLQNIVRNADTFPFLTYTNIVFIEVKCEEQGTGSKVQRIKRKDV
ncbi:hypothetical protein D9M68_790500 [compost metagenome]